MNCMQEQKNGSPTLLKKWYRNRPGMQKINNNEGSMKELLQQYAAFNVWATQQITDVIAHLPDEKINAVMESSFPTLYKTVLHLLDAESIWWQRLKLKEHIERPGDTFTGTFNVLQQTLLHQSNEFREWVDTATEKQLQHVFAFKRGKEQHKMQVAHMLLHLFNHNSYHRGQLVTMLRQLGITKIPSTDFVAYLRLEKSR